MKRKDRILISGYYGFDNSGDDAILRAIVKDIKKYGNDVEIIALSNKPEHTKSVYGIEAINRFNIGEIRHAMENTDLFISGGGSLLQDITSTRSILYYLLLMNYAKKQGIPVMVYANGIGPINKKFNRLLTKKVLNKVDLITLRDEDSKRFLEELGVTNKNIYVTADPVFTMLASSENKIDNILKREGIPRDKELVGIAIRPWKQAPDLVNVISMAIAKILDEYDVNIILIPMHYPEDLDISLEVERVVSREEVYVIKNQLSVEDIMGITKELELIIAMRLHSLIYAATQGTPMIGLIYDPKIEGFLNFIDVKYMCNVVDMNSEELLSNFKAIWKDKQSIRIMLKKKEESLKMSALENIHMALELLRSR